MFILVFLIGLIIGSFFNVLLFRLDREDGIFLGRSKCPKCQKQLKLFELFPLLSFIILKGKCRYCRQKISLIYPIVELTTGIIFTLFYLTLGLPLTPDLSYSFLLIIFFILIIFFDYIYYIIPDKLVFPFIGIAVIFSLFFKKEEFLVLLISGLLLGGLFAILYLVSKGRWVGLGDAKLLLLIGLVFGYPYGFLITLFSIWSAALVGLVLIAIKKASLKSELPFGLFLSVISIIFIILKNETQIFKYFFY